MENVNTELTQADNTAQQDPATTAALLEQEIMAELQAGALQLKDGLPFGIGADCVMQYAVTFRELTTGDVIDAQTASEIPVTTAEGPMLVSSPSKMGVEMLRRSIATVGSINGPLSVALLRQLSQADFHRLSLALELRDLAQAASLSANRGEWLRCRAQIEQAVIAVGMIMKGGPTWAMGLPLSQLLRYCKQAEQLVNRK